MSDWSVRKGSNGAQRLADTLMRATGGCRALFFIPALQGDSTDAGQLGIDKPDLQALSISPVSLRKTQPGMIENQAAQYELLVSASAIAQQVTILELSGADALLSLVANITVSSLSFLLEEWACTISLGQPVFYRLLLRPAEAQKLNSGSEGD